MFKNPTVGRAALTLCFGLAIGHASAGPGAQASGRAQDESRPVDGAVQATYFVEAQLFGLADFAGQQDDRFGWSVATDGDVMVVGAPQKMVAAQPGAGAAYVFVRAGATWIQQRILSAPDPGVDDGFGTAVSIAGNTIIVGAPGADRPGTPDAGAAYVFVRSGTSWLHQQKLYAPDGAPLDVFGTSVSVSGDTAVAGAPAAETSGGTDAGAAYVFARSGTTWSSPLKLTAADGAAADSFGVSVSIAADTLIAGAAGDDTAAGPNTGSAYVFVRAGPSWSPQGKLVASDAAPGDSFGIAVAASGDTAVVGSLLDDNAAGTDAGSAYVFARSGGSWSQQLKLAGSGVTDEDLFGASVAIADDTIAVGARSHDVPTAARAGAAYVYLRAGATWTESQRLIAADPGVDDGFGQSVAIAGGTVIVGAPLHDVASIGDAGAAYAFEHAGAAWPQRQQLVAGDPGSSSDGFGYSIASSGNTLLMGAYLDSTAAGQLTGAAYVFVRDGSSWRLEQKLLAPGAAPGDAFGVSVALDGDTAVIGTWLADAPAGIDAGAAYVFVRTGNVWTSQQKLTSPDAAIHDHFGVSVAVSGDTVVVGAPGHATANGSDAGSAYVFVRSGAVWTQQARLEASDGAAFDEFGGSVTVAGDTAVVGAYFHDTPSGTDSGTVYVFARSGTAWTEQVRLLPPNAGPSDRSGTSVSLDADTIVAGAIGGGGGRGAAHVWVRAGPTWTLQQELLATDGSAGDQFGRGVSVRGDAIVVGAPSDRDPSGIQQAGSAYVFERSGGSWAQGGKLLAPTPRFQALFGQSVAVVDAAVSAVGAHGDVTPSGAAAGATYLFEVTLLEAQAIAVDSAGNGVLQPNEVVMLAPSWRNVSALPVLNVAGTATSFTGPSTATYAIPDAAATYGTIAAGATVSCGPDCYAVEIAAATRPATHWDTTLVEEVAPGAGPRQWRLHVGDSFGDVAATSPYYRFVETLLHNGVTAGCSASAYCPTASTTREQMAVFVLVAKEGSGYAPAACGTPMFSDVPASSPFCPWIEELARRGVVAGCAPNAYCPAAAVSREEMAVFVLRTKEPSLVPPPCGTPLFSDVPASSPFCPWIEELARRGVVAGCGGGAYCPQAPVTREQMAVFLAVAFDLLLYGL